MSGMRRRPRVLVLGHADRATGFGRVLHNILSRLTDSFDLHHSDPRCSRPPAVPWRFHPNPEPLDIWGTRYLPGLVRNLRPDLVFLLYAPWILPHLLPQLDGCGAKIVGYCPVDSRGIGHGYFGALAPLSAIVVYNAFGRSVMEAEMAAYQAKRPDFVGWPVHVIPHGIDTDLFRPHPEGDPADGWQARRRAARRELGWGEREAAGDFVVLNANRNEARKRIDLTIDGFARFARGKPPSVKLHLHMQRVEYGEDLASLVSKLGIRDRVSFTIKNGAKPALSDVVLNRLYNACDVGVNTASAEGWGLVNFEHAATGAAQVLPRHSAFACLWEGAACLVEPKLVRQVLPHLEECIVDPDDIAAAFERLYGDRDERVRMARAAYENATSPAYRWTHIAAQWKALFLQQIGADAEESTAIR